METLGKPPLARLQTPFYILVAALLALVLVTRLERYAELAERAALETTLISMQSALQLRFILATQRSAPAALAAAWSGGNPVALSGVALPHYLGARRDVDPAALPRGRWQFDRTRHELVYVPRFAPHLVVRGAHALRPVLRFALHVEPEAGGVGWSVRLVPAVPYSWNF